MTHQENIQQQQVCKIVKKLLLAIQVLDELVGAPKKRPNAEDFWATESVDRSNFEKLWAKARGGSER